MLRNPSPRSGAPADGGPYGAHQLEPPYRKNPVDPDNEAFGQGASVCRLLIVDDDAEMRDLVSRMAACLGCDARTAASGEAALSLLQNGDVDMVITDYKMPQMNGAQLAAEIRRRQPCMPVILMTGYRGDDLDGCMRPQDLFDGVLEKPFNLNLLRKTIDIASAPLRRSEVRNRKAQYYALRPQ